MASVFVKIASTNTSWADEGTDFPVLSTTKIDPKSAPKAPKVNPKSAAKAAEVDPVVPIKEAEVDPKSATKAPEVDPVVAIKEAEVDPKSAAVIVSSEDDLDEKDEELAKKIHALTMQHNADKEHHKAEKIRLAKLGEIRNIIKQLKSENVVDGETISNLLTIIEEKNQRIALIIKENPELTDGGVCGAASVAPLTATPVKTVQEKTDASAPTQSTQSSLSAKADEWKDVGGKRAAVKLVDVDVEEPFNYKVSAVHNFRDILGMDNYCFATLMMQVGEFVAEKDNFDWVKKGCVWKGCKMHLSHDILISCLTKMFSQKTIAGNNNKRKLIQQFRYMLNNYDFADFNGFFENGKFVEDIEMMELWHESAQRVSDMLAVL